MGFLLLALQIVKKNTEKMKSKALEETEKNPMSAGQVKYREQRDLLLFLFRKTTKMKYREIKTYLDDYDFDISYQQISKICSKFGDSSRELPDSSENSEDIAEKAIE